MLSPRLHNLLDQGHAPYTTLNHARTITAHDTASIAHIEPVHFAKTVMLKVDGTPGDDGDAGHVPCRPVPAWRSRWAARLVELAEESEFRDAFPDCEPGAMPPFGNLYGMPVYVDSRLAHQDEIAFNAGNHTEVVRMPYKEFERLARRNCCGWRT